MTTRTDTFYVTTPIYYVNDIPHIGHAYTTVAADILARYHRLLGKRVFFLTGTDEHGQKVEKAAKERGKLAKDHADDMVGNFRNLWEKLAISNDAFIRTTDEAHKGVVREICRMLWDRGKIEKRSYRGMYCTPCERFWTEKDLVESNCPDCRRPVEDIEEDNYFFLMSQYHHRLIQYIEEHPAYILPESRRNEVLGFLRNHTLGDLCISRPKSRLSWGIPLPFDEDYVIYVWFDALVNYYSATRYLAPSVNERGVSVLKEGGDWWPATHHIIGKDILTTHAVYWSTMLMALDLPLPENIFAHGWWTVEGRKMSKSLGNVVDPYKIVNRYGADAFRYFLFREVPFGLDGDFSEDALIRRINTDLANDLGNLLSRFVTMAEKYAGGVVERAARSGTSRNELERHCRDAAGAVMNEQRHQHWSHLRFSVILGHIWEMIASANNYIAVKEPWRLAKGNQEALKEVLYDLWNSLRLIALLVYPFMPATAEKIWQQLGLKSLRDEVKEDLARTAEEPGASYPEIFTWDWSTHYPVRVAKGDQLFPRIEKGEEKVQKAEKSEQQTPASTDAGLLGIEDFSRVHLKVGRVVSAERVPKSDKLVKLSVDTGETRQVVAGIGKAYSPEELVGKEIVVVTNLKPAKLMGVESQGMLLAATDDEGILSVLTLDREVKAGARVK